MVLVLLLAGPVRAHGIASRDRRRLECRGSGTAGPTAAPRHKIAAGEKRTAARAGRTRAPPPAAGDIGSPAAQV
ncbi:hypothetical protein ACFYPQ_16175, partial [Streptomyces sp. NPDC005522]